MDLISSHDKKIAGLKTEAVSLNCDYLVRYCD
jgi:hypothetical protein